MSSSSVLLEEHTWPEVEAALEAGTRTAVVAVGSIEQHGPHLPLVMDALAGDELSRGDPRKATSEAGEAILERMTDAYAERIEAERDAV